MISIWPLFFLFSSISAFTSNYLPDFITKSVRLRVNMVGNGGPGWRNDDFLSSLGSDEEERERVSGEYNDFKKTRESFQKRQMERMNSPEFKKFQEQEISRQVRRQENSDANDTDGGFFEDIGFFQGAEESRFGNMMRQAQMKKRMGTNDVGSFHGVGVEQKFGVSLEDDTEDTDII